MRRLGDIFHMILWRCEGGGAKKLCMLTAKNLNVRPDTMGALLPEQQAQKASFEVLERLTAVLWLGGVV